MSLKFNGIIFETMFRDISVLLRFRDPRKVSLVAAENGGLGNCFRQRHTDRFW